MNQHKSNPWHRLRFLLLPDCIITDVAFRTIPHKQLAAINDSNPVQDTVKFLQIKGFANNGTFTYQPGLKDHIFKRIEVNTRGENAIATVLLKMAVKEIYNLNKGKMLKNFRKNMGMLSTDSSFTSGTTVISRSAYASATGYASIAPDTCIKTDLPPAPSMPALHPCLRHLLYHHFHLPWFSYLDG